MDENKNGFLSVGQMSKFCYVSARKLRYYDEQGLLSPVYRDEQTGYRYYASYQIQDVLLLKLMNTLGLPQKTIRQLIQSRDIKKVCTVLENQLPVLRGILQEAQNKYDQLLEIVLMMHNTIALSDSIDTIIRDSHIEIQYMPPQTLYTLRQKFDRDVNNEQDYLAGYALLCENAATLGLITSGSDMAIIRGNYQDIFSSSKKERLGFIDFAMRVATCPKHGIPGLCNYGGFSAVTGLHVGARSKSAETYKRMTEWAQREGIVLTGEAVEEYISNFFDDGDTEKHITRIYLPIRSMPNDEE